MSETSSEILDFVRDIMADERASERESFSQASVAAYVDGNTRQKQIARRMDAQVDAALKTKYKNCGHEGAYEPPDEDDMSSTYINCKIVGDKAIEQLTDVLQTVEETEGNQPQQPQGQQPPRRRNGIARTLGAVALGAALTGLPIGAYLATRPAPTPQQPGENTQIYLIPGDPDQIQQKRDIWAQE